MPDIVIFDPETNDILRHVPSVDPFSYQGRTDVLIFDDRTTVKDWEIRALFDQYPRKYLKRVGGIVEPKTQAERNSTDSSLSSSELLTQRVSAVNKLSSREPDSKLIRAVILLMIDEINNLRGWITSFKAETAAATNLANLQTRVASLGNLPDRTGEQAKEEIISKLNAGIADQ